jgi:hypothetical protein
MLFLEEVINRKKKKLSTSPSLPLTQSTLKQIRTLSLLPKPETHNQLSFLSNSLVCSAQKWVAVRENSLIPLLIQNRGRRNPFFSLSLSLSLSRVSLSEKEKKKKKKKKKIEPSLSWPCVLKISDFGCFW